MKTKPILIVAFTAFAVWSFAANHPNTRSVEQRLEALEKTVAAQQEELDKLRPLGDAFEVSDQGIYTTRWLQASALIANIQGVYTTDIFYTGNLVHWD